ncbi:MAG TPA: nuclear transport factor 2 family protein [Actinomycetota bacterium]|nr:nuclear transport factor 2 family protein [Actinomycetota bacterium]
MSDVKVVTTEDGQAQFWLSGGGTGPAARIENFDPDVDVLVLDRPDLSRDNLVFTEQEGATVISVSDGDLALLVGVRAADMGPAPLATRLHEALQAGDVPGVVDLLAPDVVWEAPGPADILPWAGRWVGPDGVATALQRMAATVGIEDCTLERCVTSGNTVAAVVTERGRATASGLPYESPAVRWVAVREGRIRSVQTYLDTFPCVEAVLGGRPFTVDAHPDARTSVVQPLPAKRTTDSVVFNPAELGSPPATVRTVHQMYGALAARDVPKLSEVFASDVSWEMLGPADLLPWAGPRHGPEAAAESAGRILAVLAFDHVKPIRSIYQGDAVVVTLDEGGVTAAGGAPFKTSATHVIVIDGDGKVGSFRNVIDTSGMVEACLGGRPFTVR